MTHPDYAYSDFSVPDPPHQPMYLENIVKMLRKNGAGLRVLDAGCGDGNFTQSLSEAGFEMYGIDLSEGGISLAMRRYPACHFAKWSVYDEYQGAFPEVPSFDAIVCVEVIEHLYSPRVLVQRAKEALSPGGLVIVTTPYWGYLKNILLAVTNRLDRSLTALWDGGHIKHWSYRTLRQLFEEQQFEFVQFVGSGRPIPFLWNSMVMAFRKVKPRPAPSR
jgi:2-polyprenyl-3-methyl-5-hydroxy-6-metoxy-1,4-benzoquinol methylase